jgi:integrase
VAWRLVRRPGVGLLRLANTKSGQRGERLVPLPGWAVDMLRERRAAIGADVEPVFPSATGGWRDPSNFLRVWRAAARSTTSRRDSLGAGTSAAQVIDDIGPVAGGSRLA